MGKCLHFFADTILIIDYFIVSPSINQALFF